MTEVLSLDDLRLIRAICAAGSLTGAARRLKVDHSSAFRRLGGLEKRLGVLLFDRGRTGYTPTPAGETALAAAAEILDRLDAVERRLAGQDQRPSGTVRLTTTDTLAGLLPPILAGIRRRHPAITVELVIANRFLALTRRDADIALRPADSAPEALVGRRLAGLATALYAAPSCLERTAAHRLADHDWLGFDDSLSHLRSARWMAHTLSPDRVVLRADSLVALQLMAREGLGLAALPCYLGDPDPGLRRLGPPLPEMEVSLWLLTHPDLRRIARVRAVIDAVAEGLTRLRPLIEGRAPQAA